MLSLARDRTGAGGSAIAPVHLPWCEFRSGIRKLRERAGQDQGSGRPGKACARGVVATALAAAHQEHPRPMRATEATVERKGERRRARYLAKPCIDVDMAALLVRLPTPQSA